MGSFGRLGSRIQLVGATFRPARTSNVGQYMEGSPSYERRRIANNVATPLVVIVGGTVVLQNELMEDVEEGIVGPYRTGDLLSGLRLHPNDMAVQVTAIFISTTPVWELLKDTLEECMGCTIRWPRATT